MAVGQTGNGDLWRSGPVNFHRRHYHVAHTVGRKRECSNPIGGTGVFVRDDCKGLWDVPVGLSEPELRCAACLEVRVATCASEIDLQTHADWRINGRSVELYCEGGRTPFRYP